MHLGIFRSGVGRRSVDWNPSSRFGRGCWILAGCLEIGRAPVVLWVGEEAPWCWRTGRGRGCERR
jgi:hypothetical protein